MTDSYHIGPFRIAPHVRNGKRTGSWFVDIPRKLCGKRKRILFKTEAEAKKRAQELKRQYDSGRWGRVRHFLDQMDQPKRKLLRQAIAEWGQFQERRVETRKKRQISLDTDRMRLKSALAFFGNVDLSSITEEKLAEFQTHRLNKVKRADTTVNSDLIALGKVLRWAHKNGLISVLPTIERVPEERATPVIPTREEVARIIAALPKRLRLLVWFMAETGCRSGEVFNLTWDCVDLKTGAVSIRPKEGWTPKTRSSVRTIYVHGTLLDALRFWPQRSEYVFPGRKPDNPINNIKKAFATAVATAGIERDGKAVRMTPHSLRKAYATWLAVDQRVPQRILQAVLGHTPGSRVTDEYYVQATEEAKRAVVVELPILLGDTGSAMEAMRYKKNKSGGGDRSDNGNYSTSGRERLSGS